MDRGWNAKTTQRRKPRRSKPASAWKTGASQVLKLSLSAALLGTGRTTHPWGGTHGSPKVLGQCESMWNLFALLFLISLNADLTADMLLGEAIIQNAGL